MEKQEKQLTYETPEMDAIEVKTEMSIASGCDTHCEGDVEEFCNTDCPRD